MNLGRALLTASALIVVARVPLLVEGTSAGESAVAIAGLLLGLGLWAWFWWYGVDSARTPLRLAALTILAADLGTLTWFAPPGAEAMVFVALAAGAAFEVRAGGTLVAITAAVSALIQVAHGGGGLTALGSAVNDLVVGIAAIGGRLLLLTNRELVEAREEIAAMAAAGERLRMARDLHDVLGQDLTLSILTSERLSHALDAEDSVDARRHQETLATGLRRSLDDLRRLVTGFRQTSLDGELSSARAALAAAGIELNLDSSAASLAAGHEEVLAWTLREAVTNVIRHSRAAHCWVRLAANSEGEIELDVRDDGMGVKPSAEDSSGLEGIRERLRDAGGSLEILVPTEGGYQLRAILPARLL